MLLCFIELEKIGVERNVSASISRCRFKYLIKLKYINKSVSMIEYFASAMVNIYVQFSFISKC